MRRMRLAVIHEYSPEKQKERMMYIHKYMIISADYANERSKRQYIYNTSFILLPHPDTSLASTFSSPVLYRSFKLQQGTTRAHQSPIQTVHYCMKALIK